MNKFSDYAEVTSKEVNGYHVIRLTVEPFVGVEFAYGAVAIEESADKEEAHLKFDYDVFEGKELVDANISDFEQLTGKLLMCMLEEQLEKNEVIYKGGVDSE